MWSKKSHIEDWVQAKERGNVELKRIVTHGLIDGIRHIMEWEKLLMGSCKAFISSSATKLCLPPETYVATNVDHHAACTSH
jgi:hypothetical protein